MEDTVFALKQTIAKLRHELHAKDGVITCLKQDVVDLQDKLDGMVGEWTMQDVYCQAEAMEVTLSKEEAEDAFYALGHNFDATLGITWDTVECHIYDVLEKRNENEVRN